MIKHINYMQEKVVHIPRTTLEVEVPCKVDSPITMETYVGEGTDRVKVTITMEKVDE